MVTTLRIKKKYDNHLELAIKWYSIISIINSFKWSPMEVELLAFTAIKGDISSGGRKDTFCEQFKSTKASVANSISKLYSLGFLVKQGGKTKVNPQLLINEGDILLQLTLYV